MSTGVEDNAVAADDDSVPMLASHLCLLEPDFEQLNARMDTLDPMSGAPNLFETTELVGNLVSSICLLEKEEPVLTGLQLFVFPNGVELYPTKPAAKYHSFILTNLTGERTYGFCKTEWYILPDEVLGLARAEVGLSGPLPTAVWGPTAVCVLSQHPFHKSMRTFLDEITGLHDIKQGDILNVISTCFTGATNGANEEEKQSELPEEVSPSVRPRSLSDSNSIGVFSIEIEHPHTAPRASLSTRRSSRAQSMSTVRNDSMDNSRVDAKVTEEEVAYLARRRTSSIVTVSSAHASGDTLLAWKRLSIAKKKLSPVLLPLIRAASEEKSVDVLFPSISTACDTDLPRLDLSFTALLKTLHSFVITSIYDALLTEQSVLFVSADTSLLTDCLEAMTALLYPFDWPFVYIPVLPTALSAYLEAPTPYIIGGDPALREHTPDNVMIVDLDSSKIRWPTDTGNPSLTKKKKTHSKSPRKRPSVFQALRREKSHSIGGDGDHPGSAHGYHCLLPSLLGRKLRHAIVEYTQQVSELEMSSNRSPANVQNLNNSPDMMPAFSLETATALGGMYEHDTSGGFDNGSSNIFETEDEGADVYPSDPFQAQSSALSRARSTSMGEDGVDYKQQSEGERCEAKKAVMERISRKLRMEFVDVAVSLVSGYRFCIKDHQTNDMNQQTDVIDLFDVEQFLLGLTPEFLEFLMVFVRGQTFCRFIQRTLMDGFDFFDRRMIYTMQADALQVGSYAARKVRGECWKLEKGVFSDDFVPYKFELKDMSFRWNSTTQKRNKTIITSESITLEKLHTELSIPSHQKRYPSEFGLKITLKTPPEEKEPLDEAATTAEGHTFPSSEAKTRKKSVFDTIPEDHAHTIRKALTSSEDPTAPTTEELKDVSKLSRQKAARARMKKKSSSSKTWSWASKSGKKRRGSLNPFSKNGGSLKKKAEKSITIFLKSSSERREVICALRARTSDTRAYSSSAIHEKQKELLSQTMQMPANKLTKQALHDFHVHIGKNVTPKAKDMPTRLI